VTSPAAVGATTNVRIVGIDATETVNLRERPSMHSRVLGRIPHDTRGLRSLGVATDTAGRPTAKKPFWCSIEFETHTGWVACRYLSPE
jgi:hypothetical protein